MNILARDQKRKCCILIPARSGSKGIIRKNMVDLVGFPLIHHVLRASISSNVDSIWVSTDDDEVAEYCSTFSGDGVSVIRRPSEIAGDLSLDIETFCHFFKANPEFDYAIHLRATFPLITSKIINEANDYFLSNYDDYDSMRSMIPASQNPYKMWHITDSSVARTVIDDNDYHSSPRQIIPKSYFQNACVDMVKQDMVLNYNSMVGGRCLPFLMENKWSIDIDTLNDLKEAEHAIRVRDGK